MDGYGLNKDKYGNAIEIAHEGVIENLMKKYPSTTRRERTFGGSS